MDDPDHSATEGWPTFALVFVAPGVATRTQILQRPLHLTPEDLRPGRCSRPRHRQRVRHGAVELNLQDTFGRT